jgi:hypothetical protein
LTKLRRLFETTVHGSVLESKNRRGKGAEEA